jgi:hypothetical protein
MDDPLIFGLLLLAVGILIVAIWARLRWTKLKPALFPQQDETEQAENNSAAGNGGPNSRQWFKDVPAILVGARRMLEREQIPEAQQPVDALRKLEATPQLAAAVQSVITKSLESAELHSLLVRLQGVYAYIVVVPNRHEHPHLIRRYAPFSAGWTNHADLVKAWLISSGDFSALISYLFFLSPDAKEGVLLVSYADADTEFVPGRLTQEAELKRANAKIVDASLEFKMSH